MTPDEFKAKAVKIYDSLKEEPKVSHITFLFVDDEDGKAFHGTCAAKGERMEEKLLEFFQKDETIFRLFSNAVGRAGMSLMRKAMDEQESIRMAMTQKPGKA